MTGRELFEDIAQRIPTLRRLGVTPETEKGDEVLWAADHVIALLERVDAAPHVVIAPDVDTVFRLALTDALRAITASPNVFRAYALLHDIAKLDRLMLVADPGTPGEAEGFVQHTKRVSPYATDAERVRYDALRRAGKATGIRALFDGADRAVIGPEYASEREAIVLACGLETAHVKFVTELCWSHRDVQTLFEDPGNETAYAIFPARAGKAGLNVERFLDALLGIAWLEGGEHALRRLATAEYHVMPERHAAREARERHNKKILVKRILADAGLDPERLFDELHIPPGPVRGEVMEVIYAMIRGESDGGDFGDATVHLQERVKRAATALAEVGLSV